MQVKYIGDHVKTDSIARLGLTWEPGQTRSVSSTVAELLLRHPDTWIRLIEEKPGMDEEIDFQPEEAKQDEPMAVVDFYAMNKEQLIQFAEQHQLGKIDKRWGEPLTREHVTRAWTEHQMNELEQK